MVGEPDQAAGDGMHQLLLPDLHLLPIVPVLVHGRLVDNDLPIILLGADTEFSPGTRLSLGLFPQHLVLPESQRNVGRN